MFYTDISDSVDLKSTTQDLKDVALVKLEEDGFTFFTTSELITAEEDI